MDMVTDGIVKYDRICLLNVKTQTGLVGDIAQDVVTEPPQKKVRIQGSNGFLEWFVNLNGKHDAVRYWDGKGKVIEETIQKMRPDDFKGEIDFIEVILSGRDPADAPISLERGLETMLVIAAAHVSHRHKRTVKINYDRGYGPEAFEML
jgi:predicted dehydrogenase